MTDYALSLSTALRPTKKFQVDGGEYEIFGIDHLSPDEEAEVMALFARYEALQDELSGQKNVTKGRGTAEQMRSTRVTILTKLTSLDRAKAGALKLSDQVKLLEVVQTELEADDDDGSGEKATADDGSTAS